MSFYLKDPRSRVDYAIDWSGRIAGLAIDESLWSVVPAEAGGIEIDADDVDGPRATARITGGVAGHVYTVANLATFSDGSSEARAITLRVEQS
jgi:hypothetical protein